jgi:hypothetical protein
LAVVAGLVILDPLMAKTDRGLLFGRFGPSVILARTLDSARLVYRSIARGAPDQSRGDRQSRTLARETRKSLEANALSGIYSKESDKKRLPDAVLRSLPR